MINLRQDGPVVCMLHVYWPCAQVEQERELLYTSDLSDRVKIT